MKKKPTAMAAGKENDVCRGSWDLYASWDDFSGKMNTKPLVGGSSQVWAPLGGFQEEMGSEQTAPTSAKKVSSSQWAPGLANSQMGTSLPFTTTVVNKPRALTFLTASQV